MGEAKRKKAAGENRSWAKGSLRIEANCELCFEWTGTRDDAADLQRLYLGIVELSGLTAESFAKRVAGYLMAFGMPRVGDPDRRPSSLGADWQLNDIAMYRAAMVWMVMQEFVAAKGRKIEELFVGSSILVMLEGDRDQILADTLRELHDQPFSGHEFQMVAAEIGEYLLDLDEAVPVSMRELCAIMGRTPLPEDLPDEPVYVPRMPRDAIEADAMLKTMTVLTDITKAPGWIREYAGYTNAEMLRGKPGLVVK